MRGAKSLASHGSLWRRRIKKALSAGWLTAKVRGEFVNGSSGSRKIEPRLELVETLSRCSGISWDRWDLCDSSGGYRLDRGNHSSDRICRCASHDHNNDRD